MTSFLIAYLIVWLGILLFVARLGAQQQRLARAIRDLERHLGTNVPNPSDGESAP